ncbi:DUF1772 domain-containing protein [Nocardia tengchongensis]|uniref:DUF1772 domain-containing protein n=1 Tax=Nocardia tengchongensis TaxID=2055889 RepID=A0ABX8CV58_9NOCA|nr:DUF1772 domain-containing protein [Nocardia tengchongensis]QVI23781.1 DUF1772 domain-containing protein [Nocardia tengchongensis]
MSLIIAAVTTGLLAGVFYAYACSVMIGLGKFDDKTFVEVMNKINVVIVNPVFMLSFLGSLAFSILAGVFYLRSDLRPGPDLDRGSGGTQLVEPDHHLGLQRPLNNNLATATDAQGLVDFAALRKDSETPWPTGNIARALANTGALTALCWALVQHGRLGR